MKVITFSLWGTNPIYTIGAIKNSDLASTMLPDWKCIFYCWSSVPTEIINQLESRSNVIIRKINEEYDSTDSRGMFYRFLPADEIGIERMISRDTDSRLSKREVLSIDEWISAGTDIHIMRDHPYHSTPILGGMWGAVGGKLINICDQIFKFAPSLAKGQDQEFLTKYVWQKIIKGELTCTIHDDIFTHPMSISFPCAANRGKDNGGVWFVGQVFDENDKYNSQNDLDVLISHQSRKQI